MKNINVVVLSGEKEKVSQLIDKCSQLLIESDVAIETSFVVSSEGLNESIKPDCVVLSPEASGSVSGVRKLTFAQDNSGADIAAINVQKREHGYSFEILYGSSMGRVFIPDGCEYTREHVLVAVAVICAADIPMEKILRNINGLFK